LKGGRSATVNRDVAALVVLRCHVTSVLADLGHRPLDTDKPLVEVDLLPPQRHQLATAHAGGCRQRPQGRPTVAIVEAVEESAQLGGRLRRVLRLDHLGPLRPYDWVHLEHPVDDSVLHRPPQHRSSELDGPRGQRLAVLAAVLIQLAETSDSRDGESDWIRSVPMAGARYRAMLPR
jgi:hypothetical protein